MSFNINKLKVIYYIGVTKETLITWNNQWIENEYEGLLKKKGQGRKSKLTDSEWEEIGKVIGKKK